MNIEFMEETNVQYTLRQQLHYVCRCNRKLGAGLHPAVSVLQQVVRPQHALVHQGQEHHHHHHGRFMQCDQSVLNHQELG